MKVHFHLIADNLVISLSSRDEWKQYLRGMNKGRLQILISNRLFEHLGVSSVEENDFFSVNSICFM